MCLCVVCASATLCAYTRACMFLRKLQHTLIGISVNCVPVHVVPKYRPVHSHIYLLSALKHFPLFWHGEDKHA